MSIRLYVGNLPKELVEKEAFAAMFAEEEAEISTKVIKDRKTGKCRGFAFVTVPSDEIADRFIEKYNGQSFMESPIKIEKALPRTKNKDQEDKSTEGNASNTPPKKKNNKRSPRKGGSSTSSTGNNKESFQPDPRWATQLAEIREKLAAVNN